MTGPFTSGKEVFAWFVAESLQRIRDESPSFQRNEAANREFQVIGANVALTALGALSAEDSAQVFSRWYRELGEILDLPPEGPGSSR